MSNAPNLCNRCKLRVSEPFEFCTPCQQADDEEQRTFQDGVAEYYERLAEHETENHRPFRPVDNGSYGTPSWGRDRSNGDRL